MNWFTVDKEGLARLMERVGASRYVAEGGVNGREQERP